MTRIWNILLVIGCATSMAAAFMISGKLAAMSTAPLNGAFVNPMDYLQ